MSKITQLPGAVNARKPYTIAMVGDNDAEINLYGEVVRAHPIDWWTGQPVEGDFIAMDEFLRDLDELKTKDNITIHINSVGGDFYCGLAIYNRLRTLHASITTINDGLAASAGSIIFMAGDKGKRKVHAGSNIMVHGVLSFFYGYYNAADLKAELKALESHNAAAVAAYVEATGLSEETVKAAMSKDTYMVGKEAVEKGWADEVVGYDEGNEPVNIALSPNGRMMMVNGYAVAARCFGSKIPEGIPHMTAEEWAAYTAAPQNSMQPAPQADINQIQTGGKDMEIKNIEELRKAYPEFVAQVETAARAEGATAERMRIQGIEDIQNAIGDTEMVRNAKYGEKAMTAEQLAFAAMKKQAGLGAAMLANLEGDANKSGAGDVIPAPASDPKQKTDDEQAVDLLLGAVKNKEGK